MQGGWTRWTWIAIGLLIAAVGAAACRATSEPTAVVSASPTATAETVSLPSTPDPALGEQIWQEKTCKSCHGAGAQGDIGPMLAGTALSFEQVLSRVRSGGGGMPPFTEAQVSDLELQHIYAWLRSLSQPADAPTATVEPTATAAPTATTAPTPTGTTTVSPTTTPTPTTVPTETPTTVPTPTETSLPATPSAVVGQQVWQQKTCRGCHGANAEGGTGHRLAGTGLSFDQVLLQVRTGGGGMPAFSESQVSDLELRHIHAWLRSLAPPTPTAVARPTYPTGALTAMWQHVNDMKVASDFAKDLPERLAADDAGRLNILKQHATTAVQQGQAAIGQANQALNDIPNDNVRAVVQRVVDHVNAVIGQANQALAQNSFTGAWPHAAEMVRISRLDAWPLATQAVRDAGLAGTVRVRVTNQSGSPIPGAFVTVLTAHTPVGVRADNAGWATVANVAAVPALQVKAYAAGLVYHEVHVNLSAGSTAEVGIALPGPSAGGKTPAVANAIIEPSSGAGNATVTLRVNATDPQGALNLAEDQIFALNPDLRQAYILRHVGGDQYAIQVALPNLASGQHTWYFFAVDHQCNTSGILTVQYTVQ